MTAAAVYELAMMVAAERRERMHVRAVKRTLRALHELGVEAAVQNVSVDGKPELQDGALDVYARACTGERLKAVKDALEEVSDEFGVWMCFVSESLADSATEAAFAELHFAWDANGQQVVVRC